MTGRPKHLELFCKQGGSAYGLWEAGFDVTAVDLDPQPRFPARDGLRFVQADAFTYLAEHGHTYDSAGGGPPCQGYSDCQQIQGREHPRWIGRLRRRFAALGVPYVIENVEAARWAMLDPVMLCGPMFGLRIYRHRLFEVGGGVQLAQPSHAPHTVPQTKMGRPPRPDEFMHVVGHFSGVAEARRRMGIDWMTRDGLREAIPPAYTRHVGAALLNAVNARKAVLTRADAS